MAAFSHLLPNQEAHSINGLTPFDDSYWIHALFVHLWVSFLVGQRSSRLVRVEWAPRPNSRQLIQTQTGPIKRRTDRGCRYRDRFPCERKKKKKKKKKIRRPGSKLSSWEVGGKPKYKKKEKKSCVQIGVSRHYQQQPPPLHLPIPPPRNSLSLIFRPRRISGRSWNRLYAHTDTHEFPSSFFFCRVGGREVGRKKRAKREEEEEEKKNNRSGTVVGLDLVESSRVSRSPSFLFYHVTPFTFFG